MQFSRLSILQGPTQFVVALSPQLPGPDGQLLLQIKNRYKLDIKLGFVPQLVPEKKVAEGGKRGVSLIEGRQVSIF